MLAYPDISPIAFHLGPLPVHWYGLMYLLGIGLGWVLLAWRAQQPTRGFARAEVGDIIFAVALGVILGGRLGYMFFYNFYTTVHAPWKIFYLWDGGMSFHGGLLGVIIAMYCYAKKHQHTFLTLTDFIAPVVPLGLGAGRIGNFINGELWGKITTVPWAMVFPTGGPWPRHPSQLYEFLLEGVLLFIILWGYSNKPRPLGAVSAMFLMFYGYFRFFVEFFRVPDAQIGYLAYGWLTEGQLLSLPMIMIGVGMLAWVYRRQ